jgi:hypothetical protein
MYNHSSHRRQIPLWQIAPFLLLPPVLVAAHCLYWGLSLVPFITTFAVTCGVLLVLSMRRPEQQPALRQVSAVVPTRRHD